MLVLIVSVWCKASKMASKMATVLLLKSVDCLCRGGTDMRIVHVHWECLPG